MASLTDLLNREAVALDVEVDDWESAVRAAGALLESDGISGSAYTQSMVDSVHENGPYIVLAPGFAFAHARPSADVHRTGLSWLRPARPVVFGHKSNDPVELVVAMAATDTTAHQQAMAQLAKVVSNRSVMDRLRAAGSADEVLRILTEAGQQAPARAATATATAAAGTAGAAATSSQGRTKNHIMTVCGNGVGTSLFLKNTLESVLDQWGWGPYISVEATDTVSAKGKAKECDLIMTSGEIAKTLGDLGVPMVVIQNFTSETEIDAALREAYDI